MTGSYLLQLKHRLQDPKPFFTSGHLQSFSRFILAITFTLEVPMVYKKTFLEIVGAVLLFFMG